MNLKAKTAAEIVFSSAFTLIILGLVYTPISIEGIPLFAQGVWKLGLLLLAVVSFWSILPALLGGERVRLSLNPLPCLIGFWIVILSDYRERNFGYFAHPFSISTLAILLTISAFGFACFKGIRKKELLTFAVGAILVLAAVFIKEVLGKLIFSDDHPSFLYRLALLNKEFPSIPFYNPQWNAGYSAREFFATGSLNVYLLLSPLLKLGALNNPLNYSLLISIIPFVVFPVSVFLAHKVLRSGLIAAAASIVLCLAPSLDFFEWFLRYGTLGFVCSLVLIPMVFALSYRLLLGDELLKAKGILALLISSSLCFFWTLSIAAFVPLAIYALIHAVRSFSKERSKKALIFVLLFLALNGFWLKTFITHSKVAGFVSTTELPGAKRKETETVSVTLIKAERKFLELATKVNPLLLFLGLPGLFIIKDKRLAKALGLTLVWLFLLGSFGDSFKPQLELRRMSLIAAVLLIFPASFCLEFLVEEFNPLKANKFFQKTLATVIIASLIIVPVNAGAIYSNQSDIKFQYATKEVWQLSNALKEINSGGRALFLGFILHELGSSGGGHQDGGHLAPLALWSNRELFASHYFHARWSSIDPVPPSFLKREGAGIEEFLNLMNVTEVVAFRKEWLKYCLDNPSYQKRADIGRFHIFTRTSYKPSSLIEGQADIVSAVPGELQILPHTQKIVLKYRYFPFLKSSSPEAKISGRFLFDELVGAHQTESFQAIELEINQSFIDSGQVLTLSY